MSTKDFSFEALDALLQFKVTLTFCAQYFKCSEDTVQRRIKDEYGMTFKDYHNLKMSDVAVKIQQKIIDLALIEGNPKLLELAAKYMAGWTEKSDVSITASEQGLTLAYSIENHASIRD